MKNLKDKFKNEVEISEELNFHNFDENPIFYGKKTGTKIIKLKGIDTDFITAADLETGEVVIMPNNYILKQKLEAIAEGTEFAVELTGVEKIAGTKKSKKLFSVKTA